MKYYIIAGERSGDLHAGNLIKAIKENDPDSSFRGFGGDHMEANGVVITRHYRDLAFMGFLEVLLNLRKIAGFLREAKHDILEFKPDVVILVDYGGFNLKIAKYLKRKGVKAYYYITPKVWAWNQGRAKKIKALIDKMFVILPFEKTFYKKFDWDVDYVGNPVLDAIKDYNYKEIHFNNNGKEIVAVLPGSRKQEVVNVIQTIKEVVTANQNIHFVVAKVSNLSSSLYFDLNDLENVEFVEGNTYELLMASKAAIVTSGTATLETALLKVPQVVVYKTSKISYKIAKSLIRVNYISLVNLIPDKPVVKELIQGDFNSNQINSELNNLINDIDYRQRIINEYNEIENLLDVGSASQNTAKLMVKYLKNS